MPTNTTVTAEMVRDALVQRSEIDLIGEYGQGHHREIKYDAVRLIYRVYDHGELVTVTGSAESAAQSFNAIRPKAVSR